MYDTKKIKWIKEISTFREQKKKFAWHNATKKKKKTAVSQIASLWGFLVQPTFTGCISESNKKSQINLLSQYLGQYWLSFKYSFPGILRPILRKKKREKKMYLVSTYKTFICILSISKMALFLILKGVLASTFSLAPLNNHKINKIKKITKRNVTKGDT